MSSWTSGGSWLSALTTTASEPEPESEQQPKAVNTEEVSSEDEPLTGKKASTRKAEKTSAAPAAVGGPVVPAAGLPALGQGWGGYGAEADGHHSDMSQSQFALANGLQRCTPPA